MTTQPGEGGKQAASPSEPEIIHLTSDHDNIGEPQNWCGEESLRSTEALAETTCIGCLKSAKIYGEGAATRLQQIAHALVNPQTDLGYPRCEHKGCPSKHYRFIQRRDWEVKAGMPRSYSDDPQDRRRLP